MSVQSIRNFQSRFHLQAASPLLFFEFDLIVPLHQTNGSGYSDSYLHLITLGQQFPARQTSQSVETNVVEKPENFRWDMQNFSRGRHSRDDIGEKSGPQPG